MVVASVLGGRVLAPISQLIESWKMVANARDAYGRVDRLLGALPARTVGMALPSPLGHLAVEAVTAAAPNSNVAIIRGASFSVSAGQVLAIVGPSGSGKSSMARLIVGVWPAASGKVRLDGVDIFPWSKNELGPHLGYLPQDVDLFDGTLAENIARFGMIDSASVEEAARMVGVHESIMALEKGYDSEIGDDGCFLSGGMRQRVMIAMAVVNNPKLLIADEPTTALDVTVQSQILTLLKTMQKEFNMAIILITHDLGVVASIADRINVMYAGRLVEQGTVDEIFYKSVHPYTLGLLGSIPRVDQSIDKRLKTIQGQPPSLIELPSGCAFEPRCEFATHVPKGLCKTSRPETTEKSIGHFARCHLSAAEIYEINRFQKADR